MHQGALVPEEPNFSESSQIQHGGGKGKGPELHAENRQKETTPPKFPPRDDLWRIWNIPNITAESGHHTSYSFFSQGKDRSPPKLL
ncbi:uncharacterized protein [Branchiostoma lanceolatum]|uniref:uncharacterized protein isoform X3 n=1 Tax=Branchiostoma lanceolatum TaxID=7740 RepID=UPI0034549EFF